MLEAGSSGVLGFALQDCWSTLEPNSIPEAASIGDQSASGIGASTMMVPITWCRIPINDAIIYYTASAYLYLHIYIYDMYIYVYCMCILVYVYIIVIITIIVVRIVTITIVIMISTIIMIIRLRINILTRLRMMKYVYRHIDRSTDIDR